MKRARLPVPIIGNIKPDYREKLRGVVPMTAEAWLRKFDPKFKLNKLKAVQADAKAAKQARDNPQLVARYRKSLLRSR